MIQHGETQKTLYLQNFIPDRDLELWNDFLEKNIQNTTNTKREATRIVTEWLKIGLGIHPINNGKKYTRTEN